MIELQKISHARPAWLDELGHTEPVDAYPWVLMLYPEATIFVQADGVYAVRRAHLSDENFEYAFARIRYEEEPIQRYAFVLAWHYRTKKPVVALSWRMATLETELAVCHTAHITHYPVVLDE